MANKKSFEFRMSKKVAELTQVVHMLFTRNHEKELELESLKDAYEDEIKIVIADAKDKISNLEQRIVDLASKANGDEKSAQKGQEILASVLKQNEEWKQKCTMLELQLKNEKSECQSVRDLLIQAHQDIERLRNEETAGKAQDIETSNKEITNLKARICTLEKLLEESSSSQDTLNHLHKTHEELLQEYSKLRNNQKTSEKEKEQLITKTKVQEEQIKELRRELSRKKVKVVNNSGASNEHASISEYTEEIDKLRNEIKRYRMELYNREGNFNRMFMEKNPVIVDRRTGKIIEGSQSFEGPHMRYTFSNNVRDRSLVTNAGIAMHVNVNVNTRPTSQSTPVLQGPTDVKEFTLQEIPDISGSAIRTLSSASSISSNGNTGRLPHLGLDSRRRLTKPKPLPKGLLSAKAGGR